MKVIEQYIVPLDSISGIIKYMKIYKTEINKITEYFIERQIAAYPAYITEIKSITKEEYEAVIIVGEENWHKMQEK